MRVLFVVAGGPSHLYPLVPLAWAFRAAGHEVRLVGKAQAAESMMHTGLSTVVAGGPPKISTEERDELIRTAYGQAPWPADWPAHPDALDQEQARLLEVLGRYTVAVADGMADELVEFAGRWQPDLILHDTLALSAAVAAELLGVPSVRYTHGTQDVFRVEYRVGDGEPLPECTAMFERFGCAPPAGPPAYVDTMPESMLIGGERPCVEMRYVPHNGPGEAPDGLNGPLRRPRICLTWGGVMPGALGAAAAAPYRDAIAAVTGAGAEALVLTSEEQISSLGDLPAGARYIARAPLMIVLPHCDAIVHHGGEGSAMTAAALGIPQLVISREPLDDQCAGRLAITGAAIHLRYQHLEHNPVATAQLRDAIDKLLCDPGHTEAAARLRADIERQPTPAAVVPAIAGLP